MKKQRLFRWIAHKEAPTAIPKPYQVIVHKNIPVRSIGIEITPAYYEDYLKKQYPEEYRNRCSEPKLRFIKYRQVARELEKLTQAYSYKDALELANKNRDIISTEVIALLQHAYKRSNLEIQEAADAIKGKKDLHEFAIPHDTADEVDAQLLSLRGVGLHIAAAGSHHGLGIAALGPADHLPGFFIADGGDGAGVDDVGVRRGLKVHQRVATPLKLLLHGLRLVLVDLAAEGVNSNSHGDSPCTLRFSPI